jgi:predicted metalloprotease with PDZ domain
VAAGGYEPGLAWAAEGFTEYMSARALLDLGVWSEAEFVGFLQRQERTYSEAQKTRGTSLEEASGLAWNNGNHWDQVYAGGALLAAELDIGWVSGHQREAGRLDPVFKELRDLQRRVTTEDLNTVLVSVFGSEQAERIWGWVSSKRPLTETIRDTNRRVE